LETTWFEIAGFFYTYSEWKPYILHIWPTLFVKVEKLKKKKNVTETVVKGLFSAFYAKPDQMTIPLNKLSYL
jgi:hypothetical protein